MRTELLILFTRFPAPGQVKTRLIPALGPYKASKLQRILTDESIRQAGKVLEKRGTSVEIFFCGGARADMVDMFKTSLPLRQQEGDTLGERLAQAFMFGFGQGMTKVVIAGTDCPFLSADLMESALERLERFDIVVGPAMDGGFYLLGMRTADQTILDNIEWGTDKAYRQLRANIDTTSLKLDIMESLADIDEPEDLGVLPGWIEGSLS